jgi:hypothetical protein
MAGLPGWAFLSWRRSSSFSISMIVQPDGLKAKRWLNSQRWAKPFVMFNPSWRCFLR